jgi:dTDP-4-dehydrorhamnose reductase
LDKKKFRIFGTTNKNDFENVDKKLNIFEPDVVSQYLSELKPDYVINCVGLLIKSAKLYPDKTIFANAYFPHFLAQLSNSLNFKLIHISTDCVFSGKAGNYTEDSIKDASDIYGVSKALGEVVDDKNLTIRTSIVGPELVGRGEGLFDWFMRQSGTTYGYKSAKWSGVTTLTLAHFIIWVINHELTGLAHLTNNKTINKFDLLTLFAKVYCKTTNISDQKDYKSDKTFKNTNNDILFRVPDYIEMIESQKEFMDKNSELYKHYLLLK